MNKPVFPHPLLMGAAPVLFMYAHNLNESQIRDLGLPLAICVAIAGAIWGLLTLLLRSAVSGTLAASITLLVLGSYGHIYNLVGGRALGSIIFGRNRYLMPCLFLILAASAYFMFRCRRDPWVAKANRLTGYYSVIMVSMSLLQIGIFQVHRIQAASGPALPPALALPPPDSLQSAGPGAPRSAGPRIRPDIYYIIPDAYGSDSALKEVYGFDNSAFTGYLKAKGFIVASRSRSNYAFTELSITSSLNMDYLNFLTERMGIESADETYTDHLLMNNRVMAFLQGEGYTLVNAGSWWGPTSRNTHADVNYRTSRINEFTLNVMQGSILLPFLEEFTENELRHKVLYAFDKLAEVPYMEAPTFTLAHIICPHNPFIFGPEGEKVSTFRRLKYKADSRELYLDQVKFVNGKLMEAVAKILERSPTPPVIIIQGDHGGAFLHHAVVRAGELPDNDFLREQMGIMNAYYLPGAGPDAVSDSISPVNSFRIVFNTYFGANLPLLPDESYYSTLYKPFAFTNVTAIAKHGR